MDTSDSECFESADEDFQSDEESSVKQRPIKNSGSVGKVVQTREETTIAPDKCLKKPIAKLEINEKENKMCEEESDTTAPDASESSSPSGYVAPFDMLDSEKKIGENDEKETKGGADNCPVSERKNATVPKQLDRVQSTTNKQKPENSKSSSNKINSCMLKTPETETNSEFCKEGTHTPTPFEEENMWNDEDWEPSTLGNTKRVDNSQLGSKEKGDGENMWEDEEEWVPYVVEGTKHDNDGVVKSNSDDKDQTVQDDDNMWANDEDWEPIAQTTKLPSGHRTSNESSSAQNWGGWGTWGMSSLLTTATTITKNVSQGLSTVIESGIGVPDPEELARLNKAECDSKTSETTLPSVNEHHSNSSFGLGNWVSGVSHITKLVEKTGNKVISGGLDTLETIGKKTMEVLQEGDPGLKKKRAFLKIDQDRPVLSQMLREAKEKAEEANKVLEEKQYAKKANYETLFDDHQGLVHLEALEMLSKQCEIKLERVLSSQSGTNLTETQETLDQIKELCEVPEEDDEQLSISETEEKIDAAVSEMNIPIRYDRFVSQLKEVNEWLDKVNVNVSNEKGLHVQAIDTLALLTAICVEHFHKTGEVLLVKQHRSTADEADSLVQLTTVMTSAISQLAGKFSEKLNSMVETQDGSNKDVINKLITDVYFEASNSCSYIKDALQLLIPVLQVGAI